MASPPAQQGQRRSALRSPITWVIVLGVALAFGAYLLYKRSSASSSASGTSTSTQDTPQGTQNPDWSGEISVLQTEIGDLQSSEAQEASAASAAEKSEDTVTVPRVVGQTQVTAASILTAAGLKAEGEAPVKGRVRTVTAQDPPAGSKVARGTTVKLTTSVSKGPAKPAAKAKAPAHKPGDNPPRTPSKAQAAHVTRKAA